MNGKTRRVRRRRSDVKAALVRSAFELLDRDGPGRLTISAAARQGDVAYSAAKRCFESRSALLTEMSAQTLTELTTMMDDAIKALPPDGGEKMIAVGIAALRYFRRAPHRYGLCWRFNELQLDNPYWKAAGDSLCHRMTQFLGASEFGSETSLLAACAILHGFVDLRESHAIDDKSCDYVKQRMPSVTIPEAAPVFSVRLPVAL